MNSYTFKIVTENRRDINEDSLYNLFVDTIIDKDVVRYPQIVMEGEEGRLDLVSKRIYGGNYIEELMMINNILNPFSIVEGQEIDVVAPGDLGLFRDPELKTEQSNTVANPTNKNTRKDPKREKGVPPTIKPIDFEQLMVNKTSKTIKINTRLL